MNMDMPPSRNVQPQPTITESRSIPSLVHCKSSVTLTKVMVQATLHPPDSVRLPMGSTAVLFPDPVNNADDRTRRPARRQRYARRGCRECSEHQQERHAIPWVSTRSVCAMLKPPHGRSNIFRIRRHAYPITTRVASEPLIQDAPHHIFPSPSTHSQDTLPRAMTTCACVRVGGPRPNGWEEKLNPLRSRRSSRGRPLRTKVGGGMPAPFSEPADRRLPPPNFKVRDLAMPPLTRHAVDGRTTRDENSRPCQHHEVC
ncbi:hypothetical protein F5X68DRAFT_23347 [Plectosphaerella plurivora]|uniref:Uncharacterized protein n=1 Tax=Plectosphaerella plurivora TaxID=936078 RepID=A0A9P8V9T8_9PEZI|nr:hypothetical protein F5X68DRAFT_23347 [Plectosphaerella plurivora]